VKAWWVQHPERLRSDARPLTFGDRPIPEPDGRQVLVRVAACGVCRTDLHLVEGDLAPRRPGVVPGHEIVGVVQRTGPDANRFSAGDRIGVAWLHRSCGECHYCRSDRENLCLSPSFTGWDVDGGYAEYAVADEAFCYAIPSELDDEHAAPLLCAGIIGYRALRRSQLPHGGRLGIYGFGASAHITAQVAMHEGATVHVLTRSEDARRLALELGAASVADAYDDPPEPLDAAILFAPVGDLVPVALRALARGGTLAIAGIHLTDIPSLNYQEQLFQERTLRSVTANTRRDGIELLNLAAPMHLRIATQPYDLAAADEALRDLAADRVTGAAVLMA
jgi:propanol-preferring alcohol dehydrogenase